MLCHSLTVYFIYLTIGLMKQATNCDHDGKDFLVVMPQTYPQHTLRTHVVTILGVPGQIILYSSPWQPPQTAAISEDSSLKLTFRHQMLNANFNADAPAVQKLAVRIKTGEFPVVVFVHTEGADGYLATPRRPLVASEFIVASFPVQGICTSYIAVTSFFNDNMVMIDLELDASKTAFIGDRNINTGQPFNFTLRAYNDVLLIRSTGDMSGTKIFGTHAISVFSGINCACVFADGQRCQGILEQMPRTRNLGGKTVLPPLSQIYDNRLLRAVAASDGSLTFMNETFPMIISEWRDWNINIHSDESPRATNKFLLLQTVKNGNNIPKTWVASHAITTLNRFFQKFRVLAVSGYKTELAVLHSKSPSGTYSLIINDVERSIANVSETHSGFVGFIIEVDEGVLDIQSSAEDAKMLIYIYSYGPQAMHSFPAACVRVLPNINRRSTIHMSSTVATSTEAIKQHYNSITSMVSHRSKVHDNIASEFEDVLQSSMSSLNYVETLTRRQMSTSQLFPVLETIPMAQRISIVNLAIDDSPVSAVLRQSYVSQEQSELHTSFTSSLIAQSVVTLDTSTPYAHTTKSILESKYFGETPVTTESIETIQNPTTLLKTEVDVLTSEKYSFTNSENSDETRDDQVFTTINNQQLSRVEELTMHTHFGNVQLYTEQTVMITDQTGIHESTVNGYYPRSVKTSIPVTLESEDTLQGFSSDYSPGSSEYKVDGHSRFLETPSVQLQTSLDKSSSKTVEVKYSDIRPSIPQHVDTSVSTFTFESVSQVPSRKDSTACPKLCPCFTRAGRSLTLKSMRRPKLILNKKLLTVQIRKKNSVPDGRISSQSIGALGITLVIVPVVAVVFADVKLLIWR